MFRSRYTAISLLALAFFAVLAACGGGQQVATPAGVAINDAGKISTNYVIAVMSQGSKSSASELTFAKMDDPVPGEDAVARFRVNGHESGPRNPVLLRMSFLDELPALEPGGIYAIKRLQNGMATTSCLPGSRGGEILLTISRSGEYLVTRESRAAVSQAEEFIVFASADSAGGLAPLLVNFRAWTDVELTGVTYQWDFGDGTQSEEQEAAHTYTDDGSYIVTLTATHGTDIFTAVSTPIEVGLNISFLSGYVVDDTGAPLQNVAVSAVTEDGIAATTTTDSEGFYSFSDLPQRTYCVTFALDGFQPANLVANLDEGTEVLDAQMPAHAEIVDTAPEFAFDDPPYSLNESTGVAQVWGTVAQFYGVEIAVSLNGAIRAVPVSGNSFSTEVVLRPGNNDIRFIAANEAGVTISDPISIFYEAWGTILFRATLSWDGSGDMDLHVQDPNGEHCYFGNQLIGTGNLDVDNVTSYGPENFTCIVPDGGEPVAGTYHVYVHYYSGIDPRNCTITLLLNPGTAQEQIATFGPYPLDSGSIDWYAVDVYVGADGIATYTAPGTPPGGAE